MYTPIPTSWGLSAGAEEDEGSRAPEPVKVAWPHAELDTVDAVPLYLDFLRLGFQVREAAERCCPYPCLLGAVKPLLSILSCVC